MTEPRWLTAEQIYAIHLEQLALCGGGEGLRDEGLLESALARPQQLAAYGDPDLCALAASYTYGIAKNHPFVDGNKRVAFLACYAFLKINGTRLIASQVDATLKMLALAAGELTQDELTAWLRDNTSDNTKAIIQKRFRRVP